MKTLAVWGGEVTQRLREPGFLFLLIAIAAMTTYLAPSPDQPYSTLSFGNRPLYGGSAFAGTSAGLDFGVFAGLFCMFALGGGFTRDDRTRLGELLRAQPVQTAGLVLGRVAAAWTLGLVLTAGGMVLLGLSLWYRQGAAFAPLPYATSFALLAVPSLTFAASFAVMLDLVLGRWRGLMVAAGLIGYFTLLSLSAGPADGVHPNSFLDYTGMTVTQAQFSQAYGSKAVLSAGLLVSDKHGPPLQWDGLHADAATVAQRAAALAGAAIAGLVPLLLYRRRRGFALRSTAPADAPNRARSASAAAAVVAAPSRALGFAGRVAVETATRVRRNPWLAAASVAAFVLAVAGARNAHHWVMALALLLPLLWVRAFDDAVRPRSLDEVIGALPGGKTAEFSTKFATLLLLCVAPLAGLLVGNPGDPLVWAVGSLGVVLELAWLTAVSWTAGAEVLALAVAGLWWYLVAFNQVPVEIDFAGLWSAPAQTLAVDAAAAAAVLLAAFSLRARRAA